MEKLEQLIDALTNLPTIGRKSATRLALHLVENKPHALKLIKALEDAITGVTQCELCGALSETPICPVCRDEHREPVVAVVESHQDIQLLEATGNYHGYYFLFPGKVEWEKVEKLKKFIATHRVKEVLFALPPSSGNQFKLLQIKELLGNLPGVTLTQLAQGVPSGVKFENVDLTSLGSALLHRHKVEG
jgi:recombination protein RecR